MNTCWIAHSTVPLDIMSNCTNEHRSGIFEPRTPLRLILFAHRAPSQRTHVRAEIAQ
jgi:hypothetical protein